MKKTESKDLIQDLCERATERVYDRAVGRLLVGEAIQVCYHLPVPRLTARLAAQRLVDPATRLRVDLLPDKALAFARQSALRAFREENGLAPREEDGTEGAAGDSEKTEK